MAGPPSLDSAMAIPRFELSSWMIDVLNAVSSAAVSGSRKRSSSAPLLLMRLSSIQSFAIIDRVELRLV